MIAALLLALAGSANAADDPGIWVRQQVGFGLAPLGLMADSRVQYRTPLARKEGSLMLNETYAGAGAMLRVSPAFVEVGPRVSFAPVDVFDVDVQVSRLQYVSNQYGLMGFTEARDKLESQRAERAEDGDGVLSGGWQATVSPTAKIKLGPVLAFDSWSIGYVALDDQGSSEPYTYEPWRDQVIRWTDVTFEHEGAVLLTAVDSDDGGAKFWLGGWARDRFSLYGPDHSTTVGPAIIAKPGRGKGVPNVLTRAMFYVVDADRVGATPNLQMAAIWAFE